MNGDAAPMIWPTIGWNLTLLERARDRGARCLLTGLGGDQIFNGDPRTFAAFARSDGWHKAFASARRLQGHSGRLSLYRSARLLVAPPVVSALPVVRRMRTQRIALRRWPWAGARLRDFILERSAAPPDREWASYTSELRLERLVRRDFMRHAELRGQLESLTGMVRTNPLMDDELLTTVASFPQHTLFFGDRQRGLFRYAMRQILPDSLRLRPDKARMEPGIAEMVGQSDLNALRSLAQMKRLADLGLVEPKAYRRHFETVLFDGGGHPDWLVIWPALAVEAFLRSSWPDHGKGQHGQ